MKILNKLFIGLILSVLPGLVFSISVHEILVELDDIQKMDTDIAAKVTYTQQKVGQGVKVVESFYYRRDETDSYLIVMLAPEAEKGNGYLKVGENMWMYRRNTRTFQHINRDESIAGTDAKTGDLETRKTSELYKAAVDENGNEILKEEMLGKIPVYHFKVEATVNDVTYPTQEYWVRKDNYLPLKVLDYSLSGTLMQTEYFLKYTKVEGKYIPVKQIFIDEFEKGNKTILNIQGISLKPLDKHIFTKAYLENLSK